MKPSLDRIPAKWIRLGGAAAVILTGVLTFGWWWPLLSGWIDHSLASTRVTAPDPHGGHHDSAGGHDDHDHGDHGHAHDESTSLELSRQGRLNLGLTAEYLRPVALATYRRAITVPAVVVARPGRTRVHVSTPLTGVVTHVHAVEGETVLPGTLLFEIRLTHEDLVTAQTGFLQTIGELDVERREIDRLEEAARSGAIARKTLLDRMYARDKLEAALRSQRQALKLHGLSDAQIDRIASDRQLLRDLQIVAPSTDEHDHSDELRLSESPVQPVSFQEGSEPEEHAPHPLVIEKLDVHKGQAVQAGDHLSTLADFSRLYIEGHAFEQDGPAIARAARNDWPITAIVPDEYSQRTLGDLKLAFVGNTVDRDTRTLSFYVDLPNEIIRDETNDEGQRHVSWRFRTGQRMQLQVPVEEWQDQIVVPVEAVIREGAEWFVFQQNGDHFDRVPVHVRYRDQRTAVIANDGSLFPGDVIAMRAAHQMQMAIRNKSGAGVDPHAGHSH